MSSVQAGLIEQVVRRNNPVELVVPPELAGKLLKEPYRSVLESLSGYTGFGIYISASPFRIGMAVTDTALSLGLYRRDTGTYDTASDLVSTDPAAVAWGERVFEHYRADAELLRIPPK